jgi:hypothetical protein
MTPNTRDRHARAPARPLPPCFSLPSHPILTLPPSPPQCRSATRPELLLTIPRYTALHCSTPRTSFPALFLRRLSLRLSLCVCRAAIITACIAVEGPGAAHAVGRVHSEAPFVAAVVHLSADAGAVMPGLQVQRQRLQAAIARSTKTPSSPPGPTLLPRTSLAMLPPRACSLHLRVRLSVAYSPSRDRDMRSDQALERQARDDRIDAVFGFHRHSDASVGASSKCQQLVLMCA